MGVAEGRGEGREGGGRENSGKERQIVGPKMPLVPSLLRGPPGPTTAGPSPGNQAEQEGASQYWPGGGGEPGRGKAVSSSFPSPGFWN